MTDTQADATVICFGEILWDSLPRGLFPGGAPVNVAYHLKQLGARAVPVTAVGRDVLGDELLRRLQGWGLETEFVAVLPDKPTGLARVTVNDSGSPSFEIVENAAWDWIELTSATLELVKRSRALVFGSLAQRSAHNRRQLAVLRQHATRALKVFDVNLRAPFDPLDRVWELARGTDLIKLNDDELGRLLDRKLAGDRLEEAAREIAKRTGCTQVCVTAGAKGAGWICKGEWFWAAAKPVDVSDTVGAGDAFLAALLQGLLSGRLSPRQNLERACRLAEFVVSKPGATPSYSISLDGSISEKKRDGVNAGVTDVSR